MAFLWTRGDKPVGTTYSQFETDYVWDDVLERLIEKDIPKDTQALIDSCFNTRLEAILDYYSDVLYGKPQVVIDPGVVECDGYKSKLDRLLDADEALEEFRRSDPDRYAGMSREQLIFQVQQKYTDLVKKIKLEKGIPDNETVQTSSEVQSENVHQNSAEGEQ